MAVVVPLPSFNHSYPIFTHFLLAALHFVIYQFAWCLFFNTSDRSLDTLDTVWKGLKQSMHRETLHLSQTTIPERFFTSFSCSTHLHKLQQGRLLVGIIGKCWSSSSRMRRVPEFGSRDALDTFIAFEYDDASFWFFSSSCRTQQGSPRPLPLQTWWNCTGYQGHKCGFLPLIDQKGRELLHGVVKTFG